MPLDFRPKVDAAREAVDADDMAEGMAGPESVEEAEPMLCCPECQAEFPLSQGIPQNKPSGAMPPEEEEPEGEFSGFQLRG